MDINIINKSNKESKSRYSLLVYCIIFIFLYALFALDRIKRIFSLTVEGNPTTNEIWVIFLICFISYFYNKVKRYRKPLDKYSLYLVICLYILSIVIVIGGFNASSIQQYIYAVLIFITPSFLFFITSKVGSEDIQILSKVFVFTCLVYSIFAIVLTTNYAFFMGLAGNPIDNYRYYSQYRASMMLGSSITVSYYFNLTLPLCFYLFNNSEEKGWRIISIVSIGMNIVATLVLLSRASTLVMVLIVIYNILFVKKGRSSLKKSFGIVTLLITTGIFVFDKYDLSRLMMGLDKTGSSVDARLVAGNLGLLIFIEYSIFGSGMGRFFERIYEYRYITVKGVTGLIDPHNLYILILSEMGITGFLVIIVMISILIKSFSNIKQKTLRQTAYLTIFSFLICATGGSHLINEISFSTIFWIYMGLFNALSIRDRSSV